MKNLLIVLFILSIFSNLLAENDYYIDLKNGNDSNDGTSIQTPWRTIRKANSILEAGDIVYIRAGTYEGTISPSNSGSPGSYITYKRYQNERVIITNVSRGVSLEGKAYIIVDGLTLSGGDDTSRTIHEFVVIDNSSHHNIIRNCEMEYCSGWDGIAIAGGSKYNKILNNIIKYCGEEEPPFPDDSGDLILIRSDNNLIEGNDLSYAGHNLINIYDGQYNIVRNNTLHSLWGRCLALVYRSLGDPSNKYNLIEKNKIAYATHYHDNSYPNPGMQSCQPHGIIRFNEFYNNFGYGLNLFCTEPGEASFTKIYNNVFYKNGYNDRDLDKEGLTIADGYYSKDPSELRNVCIKNNILYNNKKPGIFFDNGDPNKHDVAGNLESGNPEFLDESNYDFYLKANSLCFDQGAFLTHTVSSGSGTSIKVEDAGYFCDGFGLVQGDLIQLEGQTQTARITKVDYSNNTLTLDQSLNWYSGQGISFAYKGFAPDIGAYECDKPIYLRLSSSLVSGYVPLKINFSADVIGDNPPFSFLWSFGNGKYSSSQYPVYTFYNVGNYTVSLTVTDKQGNEETAKIVINVLPSTYNLTISSVTGSPSPGNGGSTKPVPGIHNFPAGSSVTVKALPNTDYRFSKWTGDISVSDAYKNEVTITMTSNKSLAAIFCTKCGDVNGDLIISPADAQLAFDIYLNRKPYATECEKENADVNCDGTTTLKITPADAQAIFDNYLGNNDLPCDCSTGSRKISAKSYITPYKQIDLIIPDALGNINEEIIVPIIISNTIGLKAFGFDLLFDEEILEFVTFELTEPQMDFFRIDANQYEEGILRLGGYRSISIMKEMPEILILLVFRARREIQAPISFVIKNTCDDIKDAALKNGLISINIERKKEANQTLRRIK